MNALQKFSFLLLFSFLFLGAFAVWPLGVAGQQPYAKLDIAPKIPPVIPSALAPAIPKAQQDFAAANPRDPFVRGLKRLDDKLKRQRATEELGRQKEQLARKALEIETLRVREAARLENGGLRGENGVALAPLSDPDFFTAFATQKYRLDGLVLSRPPSEPNIHIVKENLQPSSGVFYWSGVERRWIYEREENESIAQVARKFIMQSADLLAINGVAREIQLSDAMRLYVSPQDNAPLIHIIVKGDTLSILAKIYKTKTDWLRVRNRIEDERKLVIGRRFVIRERAITDQLASNAVPAPLPQAARYNTQAQARMAYARLAQFNTETEALRGTREFFEKYVRFIDSDIVLRHERDGKGSGKNFYNMDIGPLLSVAHGEAYCAIFRRDELPCKVVQRVPRDERVNNFDSQAIISVSPYVFYDGDEAVDSGRTDIDELAKQEYFLTEGLPLGVEQGMIAKITAARIYVTNSDGFLITLPIAKLPEIAPARTTPQVANAPITPDVSPVSSDEPNGAKNTAPAAPFENLAPLPEKKPINGDKTSSSNLIKSLAQKPQRLKDKND